MKLRVDQLEQNLASTLQPLYILSGDEVLLMQEAADKIRQHAYQHGITERLRFMADNQFDWQEVMNENQSLSLFANQRLFDIHIDKMSEKHSKALAQLAENLSQDNVILLTLPKLDSRTQKNKWFTKLESQGAFVQIWPIDANRLSQWLQQRAKSMNITLSRDAAALLCERAEGNLLALSQELEKLLLRHGSGISVNEEIIADSVSDSSRYSVYDLSDRLLKGQVKDSLHCLQQLVAEGVDSNIILWLLNKEVNLLDQLLPELQRNNLRQACKKQRIWDKQVPLYQQALQRHNPDTVMYMQRYLALLDQTVKGIPALDLDIGFRNLVMMFCGFKPVMTELDVS
ncbi:DNA polymerase III subunit delta [Marinomonas agarivorans]|nr:DNA polymerase III subunit delta [Marinomonas agarivorans]